MKAKAKKPFTKLVEELDGVIDAISYDVPGFFGYAITVRQYPDLNKPNLWGVPKLIRSGGNPSRNRNCDLFHAEKCFALALLDAIKEAKKLAKRTGKPITAKLEPGDCA